MTFLLRLLKHITVFLLVCVPLQLLGIILILPVVYFSKDYQLPYLFRWFDCADFYVNRDTSTYIALVDSGSKWNRYTWLAFRNPINYFDYQYLGYKWTGQEVYTTYSSIEDTIGDGSFGGIRHIEVDSGIYEYYYIKPYRILNLSLCIRFRIGWKIKNMDNPTGKYSQWCLTFNPFQPYTGI